MCKRRTRQNSINYCAVMLCHIRRIHCRCPVARSLFSLTNDTLQPMDRCHMLGNLCKYDTPDDEAPRFRFVVEAKSGSGADEAYAAQNHPMHHRATGSVSVFALCCDNKINSFVSFAIYPWVVHRHRSCLIQRKKELRLFFK